MLADSVRPALTGESAPCSCPHCGSTAFNRHGRSGTLQRYRCKQCRRTFSAATGAFDARIHRRWAFRVFAAIFGEAIPVRKDAELLGVSPSTVWRWRHRILAHLVRCGKERPKMLDGDVWMFIRSMSPPRTRWSPHFDFLWQKYQGDKEPREKPKITNGVTVICVAQFSSPEVHTHPDRGVDRLCLVYEGPLCRNLAAKALFSRMTATARIHASWGLGRRVKVREQPPTSTLVKLVTRALIGPHPPGLKDPTAHERRCAHDDFVSLEALPEREEFDWAPWWEIFPSNYKGTSLQSRLGKSEKGFVWDWEDIDPEDASIDQRPLEEVFPELFREEAVELPASDAGSAPSSMTYSFQGSSPGAAPGRVPGLAPGSAPGPGAGPNIPMADLSARFDAAKLHWDLANWMATFRAVRLHYLERYVEWFNGLMHAEIVSREEHAELARCLARFARFARHAQPAGVPL